MSFNKKPKTIDPNEVDPSVYYYDEVYDEMKDEAIVATQSSSKEVNKGSKYIEGLKKTAELRKAEKELRKFKRYTSDRAKAEADGDITQEDVYITSAYKKKLKEVKKLEEEKRRQIALEEGNSMNFLKTKTSAVIESTPNRADLNPPDPSDKSSPKVKTQKLIDVKKDKRKLPKTLDERRVYLREVLAKRTVGKVFDQALQRYHERRTLIQGK